MQFQDLFKSKKPLISCIHLMPLPGAPRYTGSMSQVIDTALTEVEIFNRYQVDGLIVENFRDQPFYPQKLPPETIAALAAATREIVAAAGIPVGVNALRNDAHAALAVATASEAHFIRVNVHMHAVVSDQGLLQGMSHETLRLRAALQSDVLIFVDAGVKHASPLGERRLDLETRDLEERGCADALIVSGAATGSEADTEDIDRVKQNTNLPVLIGSGATPENIEKLYSKTDGFIVGSYFKKDGKAENLVEAERVRIFTDKLKALV
ncbi:MAG: BtpA/SgcQ family protein [bacterium]